MISFCILYSSIQLVIIFVNCWSQMAETQITKKIYTIQQFRNGSSNNQIKYFDIPVEYRFQDGDCIIYRRNNWEKYQSLKTFICIPGTAFIHNNIVNYDATFPVLLDNLGEDYQIILPLHPLAPEHTFPTPIQSLLKTIPSLIQNYPVCRISLSDTVFGGYSCGGSIALTLSIQLAKRNIHFKAITLISPPLDYSGLLLKDQQLTKLWQSYEAKDHPRLNADFINFMNYFYSNSNEDLVNPWYSPIYTSEQDLKMLRDLYFIYGQFDFMRRGIEYCKKLLDGIGVKNESVIINDHGHFLLFLVQNASLDEKQINEQQKLHKMKGIKIVAQSICAILQ